MDASKKNKGNVGRRRAMRWIKRGITALVTLVLVGGAVFAALPKPVSVESALVDKGVLVVTINEDGVSRVKDRYVVSAPLSGNLARIVLNPGDAVAQGAVLARILPASAPLLDARSRSEATASVARAVAATKQAKAQIVRAQVALEYAKQEEARTRELFRKETVSQAELDRALLEVRTRQAELTSAEFADKVAAHELRMAQAALGRMDGKESESGEQFVVPSPIAGRVLKVLQKSEGVVQAGASLLELGDPRALEIVADVLTSDAVHVHPGSPVTIEAWGGAPLAASVRLVEPSAFTKVSSLGVEEQRVNAVIDLTAPYAEWAELGDGYRVEARIQVYRNASATRVPASALFRSGQKWATFVVEDTKARLRLVDIGRRNDSHAEVLKGLSVGERVIIHPSDQVSDGVRVDAE